MKFKKDIDPLLKMEDAFERIDETPDSEYYKTDRFVQHLDSRALSTVTDVFETLIIEENPKILDLMASWDSHLPGRLKDTEVTGLGLNENELKKNEALSDYILHDINDNPELPFDNERFDAVICTVSVDYMKKPVKVFREAARVLKSGGIFIVVFSNRFFEQKAVKLWRESEEEDWIFIVKRYFELADEFEESKDYVSVGKPRPEDDKYAPLGIPSDPVYAVYAEKPGQSLERPDPMIVLRAGRDKQKVEELKKRIVETHKCPYCDSEMKKWKVPDNPFYPTWDSEFLYICFNDNCEYYLRGWDYMFISGNGRCSYRFMWDPGRDACHPIPVHTRKSLQSGIIEQG